MKTPDEIFKHFKDRAKSNDDVLRSNQIKIIDDVLRLNSNIIDGKNPPAGK